jgi:hypothetical protein
MEGEKREKKMGVGNPLSTPQGKLYDFSRPSTPLNLNWWLPPLKIFI